MNLVASVTAKWRKGTGGPAGDECQNLVGTLQAKDPKAGGWRIGADEAAAGQLVTHTLTSEGYDASEDGTGRGTPLTAFNLRGREGGAMPEPGEVNMRAANGGSSRSYVAGSAVRRLTPTECERLQDWPDGWTLPEGPSLADAPRHAMRLADPIDPQPDGPRYAACGDGVTASVAEWIGSRLVAHLEIERLAA